MLIASVIRCRRTPEHGPYVIGLTGGIASGKSTARKMLVELASEMASAGAIDGGAGGGWLEAIDCDLLAHEAYQPGTPPFAALVAAFGNAIVSADGTIDRKALGALVFHEDGGANMKRLTDIVWPATAALAAAKIAASKAQVVVMEAAVLLEAQWDAMVDEVWVISASHPAVLERLASRNCH
jgi:phosphopantetheine adenylyltransferase/dephospho-CoA kinase